MRVCKRAVLFDLYGTLADVKVDEHRESFWSNLLAAPLLKGCKLTAVQFRRMYLDTLRNETRSGGKEGNVLVAAFTQLLLAIGVEPRIETVRSFAGLFRRESLLSLEERTYARVVIEAIRRAHCRVGLVSNTESLLTDYDLQQLHMRRLFDVVILSSDFGVKKPDRRIFEKALQDLSVSSDEAVFVGDDIEADVRGAVGAGIDAVFINGSSEPTPRPSQPTLARVIASPPEAAQILEALRALGVVLDGDPPNL